MMMMMMIMMTEMIKFYYLNINLKKKKTKLIESEIKKEKSQIRKTRECFTRNDRQNNWAVMA